MCYGATRPTGKFGYCPSGTVCDATSTSICVPEVEGQALTCDLNDELVDTTTAAPVTTTESTTNSTTGSTTGNTTESTSETTVVSSTTESTTTVSPLTTDQMCTQKNATGLFTIIPEDPYCQRCVKCVKFSTSLVIFYTLSLQLH